MESPGPHAFFLLFFLIHTARAAVVPTKNFTREVGDFVDFYAAIPKGASFANIQLRSVSQRKGLAFWVPGKPLNVIFPQYSGRITFAEESHEFRIHNLTLGDGGIYEVLMEMAGSATETLQKYTVFVFNVSATASQLANHSCSLDLRCEVGTGSRGVTYTWKETSTGVTIAQDPWLHLVMDPKDERKSYTCTVQALGTQGAWDIEPYKHCGPISGAEGRFGLGFPPSLLLAQALLLALLVLL